VIYNPQRTGHLIREAEHFLAGNGATLISRQTSNPKDVQTLLSGLHGKIDALWMLPDITVLKRQNLEAMALFSLENKVPILTFSDKYLAHGATVAIFADPFLMGVQAAELAEKILAGTNITELPITKPREAKTAINASAAEKTGKIVPDNLRAIEK